MRRAYGDFARTAGISDEKKTYIVNSEEVSMSSVDYFVEERMNENSAANKGQATIYHSETGQPFTAAEWAERQKTGSITMSPTAGDVEALKTYKGNEDFISGANAAQEVLRALNLGDRSAVEKLFSNVDASTELGKALDKVRAQNDNPNFQRGFIDAVGADNFLRLEGMLSNNRTGYNQVMQKSLSAASRSEMFPVDIQQQIARKADLKTLARLTGSAANPMGKDFLVEAGKRVMTQDFGWTTRAGGEMGVAVKYNIHNAGTKEILQAIAKDPNASLELLQDADFVKNGLKLENSGENEDTISQIIRSGMSKDMQANNGEKLDNALRVIIEAAKEPNDIRGTSKSGLHESPETVSERTAITLAEVYRNNIDSFSAATGRSENRMDNLSTDDTRTFLSVIQPHSAVKDANGVTLGDKIAAATAVKYMELLGEAETTGNPKYAERAANLAATYIDAKNQSNLADAKEAAERREQLGKLLGIVSELSIVHGFEGKASELLIDAAGKMAAAAVEGNVKSNNVDDAIKQNRATLENQQATNKISLGCVDINQLSCSLR